MPPADVVDSNPHRDDAEGRRASRRRASGRPSTRACCTARTTGPARGRSSTSCCRVQFQEDMPLQMYVYPVVTGAKLPAGVREVARSARPIRTPSIRPRSRRSARTGSRTGPTSSCDDAARMTASGRRAARGSCRSACRSPSSRCSSGGRSSRSSPTRCAAERDRRRAHRPGARARSRGSRCGRRCVSTVLTLVVGLPAAYVVARFDFRGRRAFRAFVTVPFVLPTVVVATAFLALLRPGRAAWRSCTGSAASRRCSSPTCSSTSRSSCARSAASGRTSIRARGSGAHARARRGCARFGT